MIILISGASHSGKTRLAQQLLEHLQIPYISQDHLKMGLIRSGNTTLTPDDDDKMTDYLWPITREMINTAIENRQNLMIEGCYIPFDWKKDFDGEYLKEIRYLCICLSEKYISDHFADVKAHARCIENRIDDGYCTQELMTRENNRFLSGCQQYDLDYVLIQDSYLQEIATACQLQGMGYGKDTM